MKFSWFGPKRIHLKYQLAATNQHYKIKHYKTYKTFGNFLFYKADVQHLNFRFTLL